MGFSDSEFISSLFDQLSVRKDNPLESITGTSSILKHSLFGLYSFVRQQQQQQQSQQQQQQPERKPMIRPRFFGRKKRAVINTETALVCVPATLWCSYFELLASTAFAACQMFDPVGPFFTHYFYFTSPPSLAGRSVRRPVHFKNRAPFT